MLNYGIYGKGEISCRGTRFVTFFFFFYILLSNRAMKREKFLSKRHTFDRNNIYHDVFIISYL